jgi:hypothetical protein
MQGNGTTAGAFQSEQLHDGGDDLNVASSGKSIADADAWPAAERKPG